jgi:hypothetical protein
LSFIASPSRIILRQWHFDEVNLRGDTALHEAAGGGYEPAARTLLTGRANPNAAGYSGETPLIRAARRGHAGVIEVCPLLPHMPMLDLPCPASLTWEIVSFSLPGCSCPCAKLSCRGFHIIMSSVGEGLCRSLGLRMAILEPAWMHLQALLDRGGAIDLTNDAGITALMSSAFYGHDAVVAQLLRRGANARTTDKRKRTALHWAAMNDHDQVIVCSIAGILDVVGRTS